MHSPAMTFRSKVSGGWLPVPSSSQDRVNGNPVAGIEAHDRRRDLGRRLGSVRKTVDLRLVGRRTCSARVGPVSAVRVDAPAFDIYTVVRGRGQDYV